MLERGFTSDGTYTDPLSHVESRDDLSRLIGGFLQKFSGAKIIPISHSDLHHGMIRFAWRFVNGEGKTVNEGTDFWMLSEEGKLRKIVGFFGPAKPL